MQFSECMKKASLVGAFFVSVTCSLSVQAFCPAPERLPQFAVAQVIDGDTLRLTDGRSVRLIGLNTPELGRKGRAAEPLADAARSHLQQLVKASDGRLGLRMGGEARDRYGRVLAHAYDAQGNNLEAALLAQGLGFFVAVAPNTELVDCHRTAEAQARQQHLGLWKRPLLRQAREIRAGGFALVEGRVERVERNRWGGCGSSLTDRWCCTCRYAMSQRSLRCRRRCEVRESRRAAGWSIVARGRAAIRRAG